MDAGLYATIWIALALFVAGEAGKGTPAAGRFGVRSPWALWTMGAVLCAVHMAIAMAARHGWSHADAMRLTALQTDSVYGVAWGGGVFVNYAFAGAWLAEALWWRLAPDAYAARNAWSRLLLRAFYFVIVVNAAVVFVPPERRPLGLALVGALLWAWHRDRSAGIAASRHAAVRRSSRR